MNVIGWSVGTSCVAAFQPEPAGGWNVTRIGRSSSPRAHANVAGMLRCACVRSTALYVPSTRSANSV